MNPTHPTPCARRLLRLSGLAAAALLLSVPLVAQPVPAPAADEDDAVLLSAFTVSGEKEYGYRASNSISGTRINTPIKDVPMNIQVFTKELADDLLVTNQVDLERYNAALINGGDDVHSDNVIQQSYNNFLFRGFRGNWGLRDGIREYDPVDMQGLARVEVVKGPAGALYGLSYPGGVMNNITKEVDFTDNFTSIRATVQNEAAHRATIDANFTGEVSGGRFGVRFNGTHARTEDHRAHSEGAVNYSQINLAWEPVPTTQLKFLMERGYREHPNGLSYFTRGETDAAGNALGNASSIPLQIFHPEIPWSWNWSNGRNMRSLETTLYRGTINQAIGDNFQISGYWQYSTREQIDGNGWDANGSGGADSWEAGGGWIIDPVTKQETIQSSYTYRDWSNNMHAYGATAVYELDLDVVKNTFAFGAAAWSERFISRLHLEQDPTFLVYPIQAGIPINVPAAPPPDLVPVTGEFTNSNGTFSNGYTRENNSNDYYFINWQAAWFNERLNTNIGVNRTNLKLVQWANGQATVPNLTEQTRNSPLYGAVFDITPDVAIFAVHSESLFPTTDKDSFGGQLPPVIGEADEIGFKFELLGGKVNGTVSYYQITQTGGAQNNPTAENMDTQRWDAMTPAQREVAFPGQTRADLLGDLVPGAEQESKGFDIDLVLQPTPNWQVLLSYAHNDQEVTEAIDTATLGQSTPMHVKNQFAALTKYTFSDGPVEGLSLGAGVHAGSKQLQDYQGSLGRYNPRTLFVEAFAIYRFKFLGYDSSVQLNARNLTKEPEYFGWKPTGSSSVIATERYEVPTKIRWALTFGIDL
ncbi:MAG TPA: TonB-dependent receptor [Candidatus Synoicihabitans sp.]|nr:TonB-dependent receptor [Candidatus Synoicihabitans sp.]